MSELNMNFQSIYYFIFSTRSNQFFLNINYQSLTQINENHSIQHSFYLKNISKLILNYIIQSKNDSYAENPSQNSNPNKSNLTNSKDKPSYHT